MEEMLKQVIKTLKANRERNRDYLIHSGTLSVDYVIADGISAVRILNIISPTKTEYNMTGVGAAASSFTKEQAERVLKMWNIAEQFPNVQIVRKEDFVRADQEQIEQHLADLKKAHAKVAA